MQNILETNLAWALIDAIKPHLSAPERDVVFVVVGAGDTFGAIRRLFKLIVSKRISLRADLVQRCLAWLAAYAGHEEEQYLRHLIAEFSIDCTARTSLNMRARRRLATSKSPELLAV
jgi:hypothetical protein